MAGGLLHPRALYLLVRDILIERIVAREWQPGAALPNEHELAQQLGASVGTVRKALDLMAEENIVIRRHGRGTFVTDFSSRRLVLSSIVSSDGKFIEGEKKMKSINHCAAKPDEAAKMDLNEGDAIIRIERVRYHRNRPFLSEICLLPFRYFSSLPTDLATYRLSALAQQNSHIVGHSVELVSPTLADGAVAHDLKIKEGTPILKLDRIVYSNKDEILEWRVGKCVLRNELYRVVHR